MAELVQVGFDGNETELGSAIETALERGASLEEISTQLGVTSAEVEARFHLVVKNAGRLGHFKSPEGHPESVDLDEPR